MTDPKWLTWALDQARRDLIDLTRRNRLLHAPVEGKRPWCMAISGYNPDELFEKLYRQENFRGYAFKARKEDTDQQRTLAIPSSPQANFHRYHPASTRRPRLQTRLAPDQLQKRLTKIFREERTLEEEQGLSTLYLALGFLRWFDSDQAEESLAPLLLVPVTMVRVGGTDGYLLRGRDDEIVPNISLREKLKSNFDIDLPDIPDDDLWRPSSYYKAVNREIRRQQRWRVDDEAIGLGFFTFSKFLMWRDLHPASWPNDALLDHPLVSVFLGQVSEFDSFPPLVPDEESIDQRIDISKCNHVVDADSSQAIVIEEARIGRNLVVQGPPGTGKSQTITNVIASAVLSGKTILFVAEKTAALEVVHDRLRKAGLGALCLEIHSRKANKKAVLKSLEQAIKFSGATPVDSSLVSKLAGRRDKLNHWSSALHKLIGQSRRTGYDVIGRQVKLRAEGVRLLESRLADAAHWTATKLSALEVAVDRAAAGVSNLALTPKDHPWFGTNINAQSPFDLDRLIPCLNGAIEKIEALEKEAKKVIAAISSNDAPSLADVFATISAFRHVAAVPKQGRSILNNPTWLRDFAVLEAAIERSEKLASSIIDVEGHFRNEAWACDTGSLLLALRRDGGSLFRRLTSRYRRANAELRAISRSKPPKGLRERIALVELLQCGQENRRQFADQKPLLMPALGSMWAEHRTPWADARAIAAWARRATFELGGARLLMFASRAQDLRVYSNFADTLEGLAKFAQLAFDVVQKLVRASLPAVFENQNYERVALKQLSGRVRTWRDNLHTVNDWVAARSAIVHLRSEGLGVVADGLINGTISPNEARSVTELLIAESLWRQATAETPELSTLEGSARTECVLEFRDLDQQRIRAARQEVVARYLDQRPNGYAGAMGIIRAEIEKNANIAPSAN